MRFPVWNRPPQLLPKNRNPVAVLLGCDRSSTLAWNVLMYDTVEILCKYVLQSQKL
jgi:hypothetical protein